MEVDDGFHRLALAEEQAAGAVGARPVPQQLPGDRGRVAVVRRAPAPHILAQQVHQRQVVAFLLGQQRQLRRAGALGFVPVRRRAAPGFLAGLTGAGVVDPVLVRFREWTAQDGLGDRLDGDFGLHWCAAI